MTGPTMRVDVRDLMFLSDWEVWLFQQERARHRTERERDARTDRRTERENF